jgi:hypothetical protein
VAFVAVKYGIEFLVEQQAITEVDVLAEKLRVDGMKNHPELAPNEAAGKNWNLKLMKIRKCSWPPMDFWDSTLLIQVSVAPFVPSWVFSLPHLLLRSSGCMTKN